MHADGIPTPFLKCTNLSGLSTNPEISSSLFQGHSSFITHLDWSSDSTYLQTNSGDYELLFWNASVCRQVSNQASLRDVEWASQSCILSFATVGVWPETVAGTDIYTCSRSRNKKLLATGDDFGKIKLFSAPTSQPKVRLKS